MGYLFQRSGISVGLVAETIGWRADSMYQVGVGTYWQEIDVIAKAWPGIKFHACEAHPEIHESLKGKWPGELHWKAISNRVGKAAIYVKRRHAEGASLFCPLRDVENILRYDVPVTTLDRLWPNPEGKHILLWLDCEGSELNALQGGERFVERVEVVNVELSANPPSPSWCKPREVHEWLAARGFRRQWVHTERVGSGQVDAIYVREKLFKPQFCCDPF